MIKYDIAIIGAGPCGIICALELAQYNKNVLLVEQGKKYNSRKCFADDGEKCRDCIKCNVVSGFGGCVHYGDSVKLTYFPSGKALHDKLGNEYTDILNKACAYWMVDAEKDFVNTELKNTANIEIKNYPVCVLNSVKVRELVEDLYSRVEASANINLCLQTEVVEIQKEQDGFSISTAKEETYFAQKVVLSVGRGGRLWFKKFVKSWDISVSQPMSTMGVRFEIPNEYMRNIGERHPDLKIRVKCNRTKYKTFCYCGGVNGGRLKFVNYGDYTLLDGHILTEMDQESGYGNFALLMQILLPVDRNRSYDKYIESILENYKKLNNGKPIYQSYIDFKNSRSTDKNKYPVRNIEIGDVYKLLGNSLDEFCFVAEEIFKYMIQDTSVNYEDFLKEVKVVGLEMESLWDKICTRETFETNYDGIYVGGDCAGEAQGILQASMIGIKIANSIII